MSKTKIAELSIPEFKNLLQETINETFIDFFSDPDDGLELREDIAQYKGCSVLCFQPKTLGFLFVK